MLGARETSGQGYLYVKASEDGLVDERAEDV